MENKGTIYKVPSKNPDLNEIRFKLDKIFTTDKQLQAKLYYLLLKLYSKNTYDVDKKFIYSVCVDKSVHIKSEWGDTCKKIEKWLLDIERIGAIVIRRYHIELKTWNRRSHLIVPRNFMRDLQSLMYFEEIEKKYDQIHYGFGQKIKSFFKKLFDK